MGKLKRMDQVKDIIKIYVATKSLKETARKLRVSKNTVREYVRQGQLFQGGLSELLKLPDEEFLSIFTDSKDKNVNEREALFLTKV
ncbi:MAG: hypothetical protein ACJAVF_003924, partial [Paraglaciecola sp.]